jgi:hypothetical protein
MRNRVLLLPAFLMACIGISLVVGPVFGSPAWTYTASVTKYCDETNNQKSVSWVFSNQEPNTADNAMDITVRLAGQTDQVANNVLGGSSANGTFNLGSGAVPGSTVYFQMAWHNHSGTDSTSRSFSAIANCYSTATPIQTSTNTTVPSSTPSITPSDTPVPSETSSPTATPSDTVVPSDTPSATAQPSETPSDTQVASDTPTGTQANTATATNTTPADTQTATSTTLASQTPVASPTSSSTPGSSSTPTQTQPPTQTPTGTTPPPQTGTPTETGTPPTETSTPPTESAFQPPTGIANCEGMLVTNNSRSGISIVVYWNDLPNASQSRNIGVFQTVSFGWGIIFDTPVNISVVWTDHQGHSGVFSLGSVGPCVDLTPPPTPPVKVKNEGSAPDEYVVPIGRISYPALGLRIPIANGSTWADGTFHHVWSVAGAVSDNDFGIHQSFAPNLAQAEPGDRLTINGDLYQVAQVVIVPGKNDQVMQRLLDGWTTITTCTPNGWVDNLVLLLRPVVNYGDVFRDLR